MATRLVPSRRLLELGQAMSFQFPNVVARSIYYGLLSPGSRNQPRRSN